ncbi:MAG: exosortase B [Rubrivivax sp.]|nr:exosortase B [Rubrivivax sp.]
MSTPALDSRTPPKMSMPGLSAVRAWWLAPLVLGLLALYVPTWLMLSRTVWVSDEQGHGPIILVVSLWLMWRKREELLALADQPAKISGSLALLFGVLLYFVGRTQQLDTFEVASKIFILGGLFLWMKGWAAVRLMLFPLLFLIFMVPLPSVLVQIVTVPLKMAVSYCAEAILYAVGYPVARTGVILSVGPYQLLVADACAGLNSMFTLEALGLLYMNLMNYKSVARNVVLAILVIPISFFANIIRVMILVLVTFHFGDEAGQGFVHDFAGMVLFMVALVLILATDSLLNLFFKRKPEAVAA